MRLPRRGAAITIYVALILILIGVIIAAAFNVLAAQWVAAASAGVPILITLLASSEREAVRHPPEDTARELARQLSAQVLGDWTAELTARGLEPGRRMVLHWRLARGSNLKPSPGRKVAREGTLEQLTDRVGRDAEQGTPIRLVVTGEIGGGKTASCIMIIVELAERCSRLPVLFQLATWDPGTSLQAWMARQLPEIFPVIGTSGYDRRVAALLASRHILPILDGMDEVREPAAALRAIDDQMSGRSFVLTCRTSEFAQANAGGALHQAMIVELQQLRPEEVRGILLDYEPASVHGPLAPLVTMLEDQPTGPVAEALSTPFMVSLARDTGASVPDLVSAATGPDAAEVTQRHLLSTFIRKTYADDERVTPGEALHYLRFLASNTDAAGRLAWWQLHRAVPRLVFLVVAVFVAGTACSGLAALFFALFDHPLLGFWIGLGAGVFGAFIVELIPQDDPRRARLRLRSVRVPSPYELARTVGFGVTGGAALAVMAWFLYSSVDYVVIGAVVSGLTFAVARYLSQSNDPLKVVTPGNLLGADRAAVLYACLAGAVPGALTGAYLGYSFRAGHRPLYDSLRILHYPLPVHALLGAVSGCVLSGVGLGLMAIGSSSWGRFIWTRLWLASQGSTPLGLMSFLRDAYRRGVLRQVNGHYEFRHRILQRYLAEPSPEIPVGASGVSSGPAVSS